MHIFNNLLNVMEQIHDIYSQLYKLEILGGINDSHFFTLVKNLKQLLIIEEELFNQLVLLPEYNHIKEYIFEESGLLFARFKDYITIYDNRSSVSDDEEINNITNAARKIYLSCSQNIFLIYLSFIQEYIETIDKTDLRERMLCLKYYSAYTKLEMGKILIENDFQIPRENYVDLYLVADMVKMKDADSFDTILDAHFSVIMEMLPQLLCIKDQQFKDINMVIAAKSIEFMIMANLSLLSESDFEFIKDNIFEVINENSNDDNKIASEIMDNILNSRLKYKSKIKKISLRPIMD